MKDDHKKDGERGMKTHKKGTCQFCLCTWTAPCFPPCAWANRAQTVCTSEPCLQEAIKAGIKLLRGAAWLAMA